MRSNPEYNFERPQDGDDLSPKAQFIYLVGALASQATEVLRTRCDHPDGRRENDSEHSHMLSLVASLLAEEYFPELNSGLVAKYANVHDLVEIYVGDTPTYDISTAGLKSKYEREADGVRQLALEYSGIAPSLVKLIEQFEEQEDPESRFVAIVDKLIPVLTHFPDEGVSMRRSFKLRSEHERSVQNRIDRFMKKYPDQEELLKIYDELAEFIRDKAWSEVTND
ncbi:HD domain-containing protein [Candidatus Saccharibacteria bacterium]|nr:HD domain-containing protein [Candidatus Saccharibacteria bacterium]